MTDTEIVSIQIDDEDNLYFQQVFSESERTAEPSVKQNPTASNWIEVAAAAKLQTAGDGNTQVAYIQAFAEEFPFTGAMFKFTLPEEGLERLINMNLNLRFLPATNDLPDGDAEWKVYLWNFDVGEWESITQKIEQTTEFLARKYEISFQNQTDITPYFNDDDEFYIMLWSYQSCVSDDEEEMQIDSDYLKLDITYCSNCYCSVDDVRLISNLKAEEIASNFVCQFIGKAQSKEIDPRLSGVFTVPFTCGAVPEKIRWIAADLASYYSLMKNYIGTSPNESAYIQQFYDQAIAQLDALANGEEEIPGTTTQAGMQSTSQGAPAIFDLCKYPDIQDKDTGCNDDDDGGCDVEGS